jgi:ATP/ADP translocase
MTATNEMMHMSHDGVLNFLQIAEDTTKCYEYERLYSCLALDGSRSTFLRGCSVYSRSSSQRTDKAHIILSGITIMSITQAAQILARIPLRTSRGPSASQWHPSRLHGLVY